MSASGVFSRQGRGAAVHFGRVLVAKRGRTWANTHLLHRIPDRQVSTNLRDLHRYAQQKDQIAVLQGRGTYQ